jgi:FtsP/CotA-like multicopper oxidase with cupredoxin domain
MAPDGVERQMLVVNGQYPGPTIEANWGDWVVVHVQNNLLNNGYDNPIISLTLARQFIGMASKWSLM